MNYFDNFIIGAVIAPTALFLNAFASFQLPESLQKLSPLIPALQSNWLMMHVTVMLFSYATLICGCILAITFLFLFESQFENVFNHSNTFFGGNLLTQSLRETHNFKKKQQTKWSVRGSHIAWRYPSTSSRSDELQNLASPSDLQRSYPMNFTTPLLKARSVKSKFYRTAQIGPQFVDPVQSSLSSSSLPAPLAHRVGRIALPSFVPWDESSVNQSPEQLDLSSAGKAKRWIILKKLDQLSFRSIGIGFPFLTIGILSGSVWANEAWGSYWNWDPKETWSLITWLIFAIYLHLRLTQNWNGFKSAILATIGFFSVWICFLGVNFLAKGLHSYGWFHS